MPYRQIWPRDMFALSGSHPDAIMFGVDFIDREEKERPIERPNLRFFTRSQLSELDQYDCTM